MPKGHSARPDRLTTLRYLLQCEAKPDQFHSTPGQRKIAGISVSYATGVNEHTGCLVIDRINHLRTVHGYTDSDLMRLLSLPDQVARQRKDTRS